MSFREKLDKARQTSPFQLAANDNEPEGIISSNYFGIENVQNLPSCLDLRFADGKRKALPYSYIMEVNFDVDEGIEIISTSKRIIITGRNLEKLFDYLAGFRVRYIKANSGTDTGEDGVLFVKNILIDETIIE